MEQENEGLLESLSKEDKNLIDEIISTDKIDNFIIFPRDIYYDNVVDGKISLIAFNILFLFFIKTNFIKGYCVANYKEICSEFSIKGSYLRKILSDLKSNKLIYYKSKQGRKGAFKVYPIGFYRADKHSNKFEEIEKAQTKINIDNENVDSINDVSNISV